jgi:hypothetical protein
MPAWHTNSRKVLNHGAPNPIVARLSLQILEILKQCNTSKNIHDAVGNLYVNSLLPRLIRCWEIEERFKQEFVVAVDGYKPSASANAGVEVPQIARLEPRCHNFLYEAKNFIRDLLQVVNHLYGTTFDEASEFSRQQRRKAANLWSSLRTKHSARATGRQRCSRRRYLLSKR